MRALHAPGPHDRQPIVAAGQPLDRARTAMILVHGRGDSASGILSLARAVPRADMAYVAPQAAGNTWYPNRFLAPIPTNEPWLSSALAALGDLVSQIEAAGIPADRIVLAGFSQGACLALEFTVRHPRRYGGIVGLSGGLIGPQGTRWTQTGRLQAAPVYKWCN
jgi:predicted esterase